MPSHKAVGLLGALALTTAACSSGSSTTASAEQEVASSGQTTAGDVVLVENHGGSLEGHTPRGFAGMGTGLFAGDNLNPNSPNGDGVQIYLTFDLPDGQVVPRSAILRSDALSVNGTPFEDLGGLMVEPVRYQQFGPELFNLAAEADAVACERGDVQSLICDVTGTVTTAMTGGADRLQFRLRFDEASDGDSQQDLALFFLTDSNVNEPGIFELELGS